MEERRHTLRYIRTHIVHSTEDHRFKSDPIRFHYLIQVTKNRRSPGGNRELRRGKKNRGRDVPGAPTGEVDLESPMHSVTPCAISTTQTRSSIFRTVRESMFAPLVIHVHRMNDRLAALEKEVESLRRDRNAACAEAYRPKRDALMVAQRLARAEAKLNRRGHSRRNDQNGPLFEFVLRLLALA